jgi:diketogulonate reductase-like aldo/keto reductase
MEQLVNSGKVRTIGFCNASCQMIREIISIATILPSTLQIECHPHLNQEKLIRMARENGLKVTVYSPFGAASYLSLNMATNSDLLFWNTTIQKISARHGKTPAQVLLRWALQRNTFPICKSSSKARMQENRTIFDFYLSKEDIEEIDALNIHKRYNDPGVFAEAAFGTYCPIYE